MAKVTIQFEVEIDNSVSLNEFKAMLEAMADKFADDIAEHEGILESEFKKVKVVL